MASAPRTLFDKIWDAHVVDVEDDGSTILYIDRQILREVTSPQAFEGLRAKSRPVRRPDAILAVVDNVVPTAGSREVVEDTTDREIIRVFGKNLREFGIHEYYDLKDQRQGIMHIVGPEQGFTLPGMTLVCGDSHTATHGAFGALAFGVGTTEVEHVLATQTWIAKKPMSMRINAEGRFAPLVYAKDLILAIIGQIGTAGATGYVVEYAGSAVRALSIEGRMTVCNMSIEAGARAGMIAPDQVTLDYLQGRNFVPKGEEWDKAVRFWSGLRTDDSAMFDREVSIDVGTLAPQVTWGTSPEQVLPITASVPDPAAEDDEIRRRNLERSLAYMGLSPGQKLTDVPIDKVFIGSCTNSRIEDLRAAAAVLDGRRRASNVQAIVVPGSGLVKAQAEREGLDHIFLAAGFEWREAGCSMCVAMNPDRLAPGERCASTTNRNFEGRQGTGSRTHLLGPAMAAAAAITGRLTDVRELAE